MVLSGLYIVLTSRTTARRLPLRPCARRARPDAAGGDMWPVAYGIITMTADAERKLRALIRRADTAPVNRDHTDVVRAEIQGRGMCESAHAPLQVQDERFARLATFPGLDRDAPGATRDKFECSGIGAREHVHHRREAQA